MKRSLLLWLTFAYVFGIYVGRGGWLPPFWVTLVAALSGAGLRRYGRKEKV